MKNHSIKILFLTLSVFFILKAFGQSQKDYPTLFFQAFLKGNRADWQQTLTDYEKSTTFNTKEKQLDRINYYYGTVGWLLNDEETDLAEVMLNKGERLIRSQLKRHENEATLLAFRGAWYGLEINLSGYKAPFLGPKSIKYINKALELDPDNIQGLIERGNALYFMPASFGGNKKESIRLFTKAIALIEENKLTENNWLYLQIRARLGQMYAETDQFEKAKSVYKTLLEEYPDFKWVKEELYPDIL